MVRHSVCNNFMTGIFFTKIGFMKRNTTIAIAVAVIAGGIVAYYAQKIIRARRSKMNATDTNHHPERHLTNVFSRAKNHAGASLTGASN